MGRAPKKGAPDFKNSSFVKSGVHLGSISVGSRVNVSKSQTQKRQVATSGHRAPERKREGPAGGRDGRQKTQKDI